ncbi:unnamed protein product [Echinostoma caproni]|uniref:Pep_M12B_propep domain-containing protein n=1 Tax=Echinostoma caproni TaxID=27848 RepID=A0A183B5E2_9TREM|nr:unnamed protein product [Echinostoma caproni]
MDPTLRCRIHGLRGREPQQRNTPKTMRFQSVCGLSLLLFLHVLILLPVQTAGLFGSSSAESILGTSDVLKAVRLGEQAYVESVAGRCGTRSEDSTSSDENPVGYSVSRGMSLIIDGDRLITKEAISELSILFTARVEHGFQGELFTVYNRHGQVELGVQFGQKLHVFYAGAGSGAKTHPRTQTKDKHSLAEVIQFNTSIDDNM